MTRPCKICGLETDCEHRNPVLSDPTTKPTAIHEILSGCYDNGVKAGLRRAVEIAKSVAKNAACGLDSREFYDALLETIEAELHVETEDEFQNRINVSYNGD